MRTAVRQLVRDSVIYGIGSGISKGLLFLLLPIYTRIFIPAEYGVIEIFVMLNSFLIIFLAMGMDSAQSFYFFEQEKNGRSAQARVVTAVLQWQLIWAGAVVILAILFSQLSNQFFWAGRVNQNLFLVSFAGVFFAQLTSQSADVFRLLYRPAKYISINIVNVVLTSVLSIVLVVYFKLGILGYFMGYLIGGGLSAVISYWAIRDYLDFSKLHLEWWLKLTKFGFPLVIGLVAFYFLQTTDRWFIVRYHGREPLGIYAVAAKFVGLILLIVGAFRQAWMARGMDAIHKADGPALFRTVSRLYLGAGIAFIIIFIWLSPLLVRLFVGPLYYSAYTIAGILSWQAIFYGFFLLISPGIWKKEKTVWLSITTIIAAGANIILDFLFVPRFGNVGAAFATSLSFFVWILITFVVSQKLWRIDYPVGILLLQIFIGVLASLCMLYLYEMGLSIWHAGIVVLAALSILGVTLRIS